MQRTVTVTGSFAAQEQSTLSVKVPGRLEKMNVDIGSVVRKGDLLAQIERSDYELRVKQAEAALAQARARLGLPIDGDNDAVDVEKTGTVEQAKALLDEAKKNRQRVQELAKSQISSQSEVDSVEAAYTVAEARYQNALEEMREKVAIATQRRAELNIAKKQLADAATYSPFDGIVHERRASPGEFLQSGTPLLVIAAVNPLRLRLQVPERESVQIRPGQALEIRVGEATNVYRSTISRVSPILAESNRMLRVEADVPSSPALRPGLFAEATIIVSTNDSALTIPVEAVTSFVGLEKAFIVEKGKAVEKSLTTGRKQDGFVEVLSGISAGDQVILHPEKIRSDEPVIIEEAHAEAR
jgi:RND family efflux transporter MFP subunit